MRATRKWVQEKPPTEAFNISTASPVLSAFVVKPISHSRFELQPLDNFSARRCRSEAGPPHFERTRRYPAGGRAISELFKIGLIPTTRMAAPDWNNGALWPQNKSGDPRASGEDQKNTASGLARREFMARWAGLFGKQRNFDNG